MYIALRQAQGEREDAQVAFSKLLMIRIESKWDTAGWALPAMTDQESLGRCAIQ